MRETGATFVGDRVVVTADFNGDGTPDLANSDGTVQLTVARMTKRSNFIGIIARERNTPVPEVGWLFAETDKMGSQRPEQEVEEVLITS
jgi:hypothetical protein